MKRLLSETVAAALTAETVRHAGKPGLTGVGLIVFAAVFLVLAVIFGSLSLNLELTEHYGETAALALTGGALLGGGVLLLAAGLFLTGKASTRASEKSREDIRMLIETVIEDLPENLAEPVRENPKTSLAFVTLAGYVFGDSLH